MILTKPGHEPFIPTFSKKPITVLKFPLEKKVPKSSQGQLGRGEGGKGDLQFTHLIVHSMMALPKVQVSGEDTAWPEGTQ